MQSNEKYLITDFRNINNHGHGHGRVKDFGFPITTGGRQSRNTLTSSSLC